MTIQRMTALATLILVAACTDQAVPTALHVFEAPRAVSQVTMESAALDDAILRIIPSLADERKGPPLAMAFDELSVALSYDHSAIGGKLSRARAALDAYENAGGEAADLGALNLALDAVRLRLERKP